MSLLIESIKLQDGEYRNLFYHEQRMNRSLKTLCGIRDHFDLEAFLGNIDNPATGLYECRIVYDDETKEVEFIPYEGKSIHTLKVVEHDRISYEFKYFDRKVIDSLYALRKNCGDILIVQRGMVKDTSYANILFKKGKRWYTPWAPLLKGTMRANLLARNMVHEEEIRADEIKTFKSFKLINAMFEFDSPEIDVSNIVF